MGDQPISPYQHVVTLGLSMEWHWLLIGLFFPLFPLSIGFNALLNATKAPWLKAILLLVWPQIGIALIIQHQATIPEWLQYWGLLSSGLYAFRMLAMREVNIWIGYLATSSWALLWIPAFDQLSEHQLQIFAFGFSLPLAIMALISGEIAKRYGAAYTGLYGGLAIAQPTPNRRVSGECVCCHCNSNLPNLFCHVAHTGFITTLTRHMARDDLGHLELVCCSLITRSYRWTCQLAIPSRFICWHDMGNVIAPRCSRHPRINLYR